MPKKNLRRRGKRGNGEGSIYQRSSDKRWVSAATVGFGTSGQQIRKNVYGETRSEVARKLDELKRTIAEGRPVFIERLTVAQFLERWLSDVAKPNVSPKSFETYSYLVRMHISPSLGRIDLQKLGPEHVQQFVNGLSASGLGPTSVKHCRDCLRAALNVAMRWNILQRNPAALVTMPRRMKRKPQVFNKAQALAFMQAIRGHRLEALFVVALCMGVREGEVLGLGKEDVDLENRRLHVRHSLQRINSKLQLVPTKTEESQRTIILPDVAVSALAAHFARQEEERVFAAGDWVETGRVFTTRKGTMLDNRNMLREYYKLRAMADAPKIRFHDLRHSAATLLHAAGVPMAAIQKLLGHASMRTTQEVYSHVTTDMESSAAAKMNEILTPVAVTVAVKTRKERPN